MRYNQRKEIKKVLLKTPDGKKITAQKKNGKIVTLNITPTPFYCSCKYDGKNVETATEFETKYLERKLECPKCGKIIEIIKTVEDYAQEEFEKQQKARENLHLSTYNQSLSSGITWYGLSTRIDYDEWKKVKHLFTYFDSRNDDDDEQDTFDGSGLNGWLTGSPHKVEEILNIKTELRLSYREEQAKIRHEKRQKIVKERDGANHQISEQFTGDNVTRPWADETKKGTQGASMLPWPEGQEIEDPEYQFNIYGGGQKYVIDKKGNKIWFIRNNGGDGDNWGYNNVRTGGAGAIGVYVEYTEELESLIKKYIELHEKLQRT